jgi:hypothetical protein
VFTCRCGPLNGRRPPNRQQEDGALGHDVAPPLQSPIQVAQAACACALFSKLCGTLGEGGAGVAQARQGHVGGVTGSASWVSPAACDALDGICGVYCTLRPDRVTSIGPHSSATVGTGGGGAEATRKG